MNIQKYDDYFCRDTVQRLYDEVRTRRYTFSEYDGEDQEYPNGAICYMEESPLLMLHLMKFMSEERPDLMELQSHKSYINCYRENELSRFHTDNTVKTILYYVNPIFDYNPDIGGGTEFIDIESGDLKVITPLGGRIVVFDGDVWHRATPFTKGHRFTAVMKLVGNTE